MLQMLTDRLKSGGVNMSMSNAQRGLLNEARVDVGYRNLQRGTYATHNTGQASE